MFGALVRSQAAVARSPATNLTFASQKLLTVIPALNLGRSAKLAPAPAVDVHVLRVRLALGERPPHDQGHQQGQQGECDEHLHLVLVEGRLSNPLAVS